MPNIYLPSRIGSGFGQGFTQFFAILQHLRSFPETDPIIIDKSACKFLTPFFVLPFVVLMKKEALRREVICKPETSAAFQEYGDYISFHNGIRPEEIPGGSYGDFLNRYIGKTYIPIIDFPVERSDVSTTLRDNFLEVLSTLLIRQLNLKGNILTAVSYLLAEAVNNIVDHCRSDRGFIFAQYYPSRSYIDICIADGGVGILQTYLDQPNSSITSDKDAIRNAALGISTKDRPFAESRGFGISTSKNMLADGLDGKYFILSGRAFLYKFLGNEQIVEVPEILKWNGTIVALRVPYGQNNNFNPADYYGD